MRPGRDDAAGGLVRSIQGLFEDRPPSTPTAPAHDGGGTPEGRLRTVLLDYLQARPGARQAEAARLETEAANVLEQPDGADSLAPLVEHLAQGIPDSDRVRLARRLVGPEVAVAVTARVREAARDEARREEMVALAGVLGATLAPTLARELAEVEDRSERRALMEAIAAAARDAPEVVEAMVRDSRWFVVRNGVTLLGELRGTDALDPLTGTLAHEHPRVRRESVMALARIGGGDAELLILGMLDDPDEGVRAAAAMALGVLGVSRAVRPLMERLEEEESPDVQTELIRALGQLGDPGAVPLLEKRARPHLFTRHPLAVRIAAYRALAAVGTPHAREVLEEGLDDRDPDVRHAVRMALRERGS